MGHRSNFFRLLRFFHDPEKFTPLAKLYIQTSVAYMLSIHTNITKAQFDCDKVTLVTGLMCFTSLYVVSLIIPQEINPESTGVVYI